MARFGELIRETLAGAGIKGVRFRPEAHEDLVGLPINLVVLEVPDVAAVVEALNDDDAFEAEAEVIEVEGYRCTVINICNYSDGPADADQEEASVPVAVGDLGGGTDPTEEDEQFEPLRIALTTTVAVVFVETPDGVGSEWDASDFLSEVGFRAEDVFRISRHAAKIQPLLRTALLFSKLLDRVAPDLRRHPRAEELLVQMHDHAGELLLKHSELELELNKFEREVRAARILEELSGVFSDSLDLKLSLEESKERLKHVIEFTQRQIESRGLHADLGLNRSMLWLTLVTLAFGLLTLFDKYQSDRTFGLDAWTGLYRMSTVGLLLVLTSALSFRHHLFEYLRFSRFGRWWQRVLLYHDFSGVYRFTTGRFVWQWPVEKVRSLWFGLQVDAAWWASLESLQRIHTQVSPRGTDAFMLAFGNDGTTDASDFEAEANKLNEAATDALCDLEVALNYLEASFDDAGKRWALAPPERIRQVEAITRYQMRVSSLVLEWELPLLPKHEVAYWLIAKPHIFRVGDNIADEHDSNEVLADTMPPWEDALGLAALMVMRMEMPVSEVDWLTHRLDAAAMRLLASNPVEPVGHEGALFRLLHPPDASFKERSEYCFRYSVAAWVEAANAEGLTYDNLSQRWAEAQRREDEAEARG